MTEITGSKKADCVVYIGASADDAESSTTCYEQPITTWRNWPSVLWAYFINSSSKFTTRSRLFFVLVLLIVVLIFFIGYSSGQRKSVVYINQTAESTITPVTVHSTLSTTDILDSVHYLFWCKFDFFVIHSMLMYPILQ